MKKTLPYQYSIILLSLPIKKNENLNLYENVHFVRGHTILCSKKLNCQNKIFSVCKFKISVFFVKELISGTIEKFYISFRNKKNGCKHLQCIIAAAFGHKVEVNLCLILNHLYRANI